MRREHIPHLICPASRLPFTHRPGHVARRRPHLPDYSGARRLLSIVFRDVGAHDSSNGKVLLADPAIEVVESTWELQLTIVCHIGYPAILAQLPGGDVVARRALDKRRAAEALDCCTAGIGCCIAGDQSESIPLVAATRCTPSYPILLRLQGGAEVLGEDHARTPQEVVQRALGMRQRGHRANEQHGQQGAQKFVFGFLSRSAVALVRGRERR
eukprot:scaffold92450_cov69-Phaeocystis_antarctica.AAC.2